MPTTKHSTLTGAHLHPPLGDSRVGALDLPASTSNAILVRAADGSTAHIAMTTSGTNTAGLELSNLYELSTTTRWIVVGNGQATKDRGIYFYDSTVSLNTVGGAIFYDTSANMFTVANYSGANSPPSDADSEWDDALTCADFTEYADFSTKRIRLQTATAASGYAAIYKKSDDELYYHDGSSEVQLTDSGSVAGGGSASWTSVTNAISGSSSGDILSLSAADATVGWIQFHVAATNGATSQGTFSGVVHFKRESGGTAEILFEKVEGLGEGSIDVAVMVDTGDNTVGLTGYAASASTSFTVDYMTGARAL